MPQKYDVIVVGGGVAGSAAAILLGRVGREVLLLEKEKSAHHKVCGEFISFEAEHYLSGLDVDVMALGAQRISRIHLSKGSVSAASDLPFIAASLSRYVLDHELLQKAAQSCEVQCGISVKKISHDVAGWAIETSAGAFFSKAVFLATGKHDLPGWHRPNGKVNDLIGFKMHYDLATENMNGLSSTVKFFLFKNGYGALEPVEQGRVNLCLVVKKSEFQACHKDWNELLENIVRETRDLKSYLAEAKACWNKPLAIYNIPYGFIYRSRPHDPPDLYRIGDQMAVIPSFCGEGMAIALDTAHKSVSYYLENRCTAYHVQMKKELSPQMHKASMLARVASSNLGQFGIATAARMIPRLLKIWAKETRLWKSADFI